MSESIDRHSQKKMIAERLRFIRLFRVTKQYGRFYVATSYPGNRYFYIQIIPDGEKATNCGEALFEDGDVCGKDINEIYPNKNYVLVYCYMGTDYKGDALFGWKHKGPWIENFRELAKKEEKEIRDYEEMVKNKKKRWEIEKKRRIANLLAKYQIEYEDGQITKMADWVESELIPSLRVLKRLGRRG